MPLGIKPKCFKCSSEACEIWHKNIQGNTVCNECNLKDIKLSKPEVRKSLEKITPKCPVVESANDSVDFDDLIMDEITDDIKAGPGTRSGNGVTSTRGSWKQGSKKSGRGRNKKAGNSNKAATSKGRGRRAVFKKQVPY